MLDGLGVAAVLRMEDDFGFSAVAVGSLPEIGLELSLGLGFDGGFDLGFDFGFDLDFDLGFTLFLGSGFDFGRREPLVEPLGPRF